jgi:long-chain fatty acid transport protein
MQQKNLDIQGNEYMSVRSGSTIALVAATAMLLAQQLQAGGFYIAEVGTPTSLGTAGAANVTNTYGPDAAWTNPAGMTNLDSDQMMAGFQLVVPSVEFDSSRADAGGNDGHNAGNVAAIPSLFYVKKTGDRSRFGFSVVAPMGGGVNYGDDFVGRYGATKVALQVVGLSPSFAYEVNDRLSLGAGVSMIYTRYDQNIAINLPLAIPDGKVKIENATDWGYQPFLGLQYQLSEKTLLGVIYRAEADVDLEGDLNFRNMPSGFSPAANEIDVGWDNPQLLEVGIRHRLRDDLILVANADWQDWSQFSENRLEPSGGILNPKVTLDRNWKDTWHVGVGVLRILGAHAWSAGVGYDSSVVEDKDRTIDLPLDQVIKFSGAYAWKGSKQLDFSLGATLAYLGEGKVDQEAQGVRFKGEFDTNYVLFAGGTVRYTF